MAVNTTTNFTIVVDDANTEVLFYLGDVCMGRITTNLPASGAVASCFFNFTKGYGVTEFKYSYLINAETVVFRQ